MSDYLKYRQDHINNGRPLPTKKKTRIKPVSDKRMAKLQQQKESGEDNMMPFYEQMRPRLTGFCQCGCKQRSQKHDTIFFYCICHIFPKALFPSVKEHPLVWVERRFWGGCHANMDNRSIELWPQFADWPDIKRKFKLLSPLLTKKEKAKKFYTALHELVKNN